MVKKIVNTYLKFYILAYTSTIVILQKTLFQTLFKITEDQFLGIFLPHLQRLVEDKQEQSHRCAAEIIGGLIKGCKHWHFKQVENLWNLLLPILKTALLNISSETIADWGLCIGMGLEAR